MAQKFANRWEIIEPLGEGGQGQAFVVRDTQISTNNPPRFVLKRLKNPKRLDRFRREVEATIKLNHPNILKIIDHDLKCKKPYLISEYCTGGTLREFFSKATPSLMEIFRLFLLIADGLRYAHENDVIHRDIKPDNIFLRLPLLDPVIGDFGLCYLEDSVERITMTQEAVGPRIFMAPEMEDGRIDRVTPSADIYSLGKLFYWMLSGGRIFSREKMREPQWDLKKIVPHPYEIGDNNAMEHITRLLRWMITPLPADRRPLKDIISAARRIQCLIHRGVNPISESIPQTCTYCGWGHYDAIVDGGSVHNFGFVYVGDPKWKILACTECGHIQLFRLDHARRDNLWKEQ